MRDYQLEVFEQTSDYAELRLRDGDDVRTRGLKKVEIDELIEKVGQVYGKDAVAPLVYGSGDLVQLGQDLFEFLDGNERWLSKVLTDPSGSTLRIAAEERLRHLPWELMAEERSHLAVNTLAPFTPVRRVSPGDSLRHPEVANRPLRVLFMATSPEGVEPVLHFESEEAMILDATTATGAELVVEESGTLEGLRFVTESYGTDYFDIFHLSGHANVDEGSPVFLVENEVGGRVNARPDQIAQAIGGRWPRLVFVSGCLTGNAPDQGQLPSMSESLVQAGAPAVLGWALPVGDTAASITAAILYQGLASGRRLDEAVARARQELYTAKSTFWHFLRLYTDASPLAEMVTPLNTPGRERLTVRPASSEFMDPQTQLSRVASRQAFVGRRRLIQRCLRTLKTAITQPEASEGLVLQGMGGLGKSTLASRLLERMPTHQRAVWFGRVDETKFRDLTSKIRFETLANNQEADKILNTPDASLEMRVRYLLDGPMRNIPCLFVFDDFERGNLDERDGAYVGTHEINEILSALLKAIRQTSSASRVILTSRYEFPAPAGTRLRVEALETLNRNELAKKLQRLDQLRPDSPVDTSMREKAIEVAAGNPRLLEWLNLMIDDPSLDVQSLLAAIEGEAVRFREDIFAEKLLESQAPALQKMLAMLNVVELPVPGDTLRAIFQDPDVDSHMERASELGLLESGIDPETGERRYFVS